MNSATAEKAIDEKASLPTSGKLRRLAVAVTAACVLATSTSAWAKSACYSAAEYDAEQAVRLHTELMVIGLTCNAIEADRKLFAKYQQFTTKHRTSLMNWEKVLIGHFRETDKSNPTRKFDDFRTVVANEIAQRSALLTPPVFCQTHSDIVDQASEPVGQRPEALSVGKQERRNRHRSALRRHRGGTARQRPAGDRLQGLGQTVRPGQERR